MNNLDRILRIARILEDTGDLETRERMRQALRNAEVKLKELESTRT